MTTWYILTEKEIFKLANIKHSVMLLLVIRLAITYSKITLKKYLYTSFTSGSSVLVAVLLTTEMSHQHKMMMQDKAVLN